MITVFSKEWFKKHNSVLVKLAKLPFIGEWIFHIKKFGATKYDGGLPISIQVEKQKGFWN